MALLRTAIDVLSLYTPRTRCAALNARFAHIPFAMPHPMRMLIVDVLEALAFKVLEAADAAKALRLCLCVDLEAKPTDRMGLAR